MPFLPRSADITRKNLARGFLPALMIALLLMFKSAPAAAQAAPDKLPSPLSQQSVETSQFWASIYPDYLFAPGPDGLIRFDYGALKKNISDYAALKTYIKMMEAKNPAKMEATEASAYWANLYNAVTIDVVTENYPLESIRDLKSGLFSRGPWRQNLVIVEGRDLSLDNIEHDILRKKYASPFVHYMINCASVSCPNLPAAFWQASSLEAAREQAARDYLASPRGVRLGADGGLYLSSIYKWFEEDFGGSKTDVLSHIRAYGPEPIKAAIDNGAPIKKYAYDWSLNDAE